MARYDFLIVGAGLFGAVFAQQCKERGKTCLVIDKRSHIAGNVYTKRVEDIDVHVYGPHTFHTNSNIIWAYVNRFTEFAQYAHRVKVNHCGKIYSMPINLQTIYEVYGARTPAEAKCKLDEVRVPIVNPQNLEEWCLSQVGPELYDIFIKHYTMKQWFRDPRDLPVSIIKRLPIRLNFDDRWHHSAHSGIPVDGYTQMVANMLDGIDVELEADFLSGNWTGKACTVVYTGPIDALFGYCYGALEYRTLRFVTKTLDGDYQGIAQINYTDESTPFTRVIEHKHFNYRESLRTLVTWEYPKQWSYDSEPFYPINDRTNNNIYRKYVVLAKDKYIIGGRLGSYMYLDMDQAIASALKAAKIYI